VREFLVRTSILERMCPPLCDALTGAGDGAALLAEAYRSNLFLVALDEQGHWYRYHHLFRDLLRRELAHRESGLVADLHARAAAWHRDNGNVEEAIMHAIAAGQVPEASELIARHWQRAWDANPRTAARWLDALPPGAVEQHSRLSMARGWAALFMGPLDAVEPAVRAAEISPFQGPDVAVLGTLADQAALLRAALAYLQGDLGRAQEMAERALGDDATPPGRALAGLFGGVARFFRGDRDGAVESLERTRRALAGPGWVQVQLTTLSVLATANLASGDISAAQALSQELERLIEESGLGEAPTASLPRSVAGMLLEAAGDLEAADAAYTRAALLAGRGGGRSVDRAHALLLGAALNRRRKDVASARSLARDARLLLATCNDPGVLSEVLAETERALRIGSPVRSAAPLIGVDIELSARELAVLRMLTTDLSQREIGAELDVSMNTVKTHTRALFRKLDVATRTDAVSRARELGLL
jgi:LuxR family maltose regulon positive regulatory protein